MSSQVKTWFQNRRMKHKKQLRKMSDDKKVDKQIPTKENLINIHLPVNTGRIQSIYGYRFPVKLTWTYLI